MENGAPAYPDYGILLSLAALLGPTRPVGGFSEASGLSAEIDVAEYRDGDERSGSLKSIDVTLKRGVVDSAALRAWIGQARTAEAWVASDATITFRDEANHPVQIWKLSNARATKYRGPTLSGKGGGDVAIEELVLSAERIELTLD